jgi:hypothetical protein
VLVSVSWNWEPLGQELCRLCTWEHTGINTAMQFECFLPADGGSDAVDLAACCRSCCMLLLLLCFLVLHTPLGSGTGGSAPVGQLRHTGAGISDSASHCSPESNHEPYARDPTRALAGGWCWLYDGIVLPAPSGGSTPPLHSHRHHRACGWWDGLTVWAGVGWWCGYYVVSKRARCIPDILSAFCLPTAGLTRLIWQFAVDRVACCCCCCAFWCFKLPWGRGRAAVLQ